MVTDDEFGRNLLVGCLALMFLVVAAIVLALGVLIVVTS